MLMQISKYYCSLMFVALTKMLKIFLQKNIYLPFFSYIRGKIPESSPGFKNFTHLFTARWWHTKLGTSVTCGTLLCLVPLTSQLKQLSTLLPLLWPSVVFGTQPRIRIWTYTFGFVAFPWTALTLSPLSDQTTEKKFLDLFDCGSSMALYWMICHWSRLKQHHT